MRAGGVPSLRWWNSRAVSPTGMRSPLSPSLSRATAAMDFASRRAVSASRFLLPALDNRLNDSAARWSCSSGTVKPSDVKSDAEGGGGGTGACDGGSFATGADADEETTALPAEAQVRPSG
ncbi:hypothetical protein BHM03_00002158 [Ensete ventricosum]|nr:hypothetical protein BHM03_00002158 [Ensete ventricosum]